MTLGARAGIHQESSHPVRHDVSQHQSPPLVTDRCYLCACGACPLSRETTFGQQSPRGCGGGRGEGERGGCVGTNLKVCPSDPREVVGRPARKPPHPACRHLLPPGGEGPDGSQRAGKAVGGRECTAQPCVSPLTREMTFGQQSPGGRGRGWR